MSTVAQRRVAGRSTTAETYGFCGIGNVFDRGKLRPFMTAVAKGLRLALTARAPEIRFTFNNFNFVGHVLRGFTLAHCVLFCGFG